MPRSVWQSVERFTSRASERRASRGLHLSRAGAGWASLLHRLVPFDHFVDDFIKSLRRVLEQAHEGSILTPE